MASAIIQAVASVFTSVFTSLGVGAALAGTLGNLAAGVLFSAITSKRSGSQQDLRQALRFPTSLPHKRFIYGEPQWSATPLPSPGKDGYYYGAWLVNSRPSEGDFDLYLDGRPVTLTGDPYDFTGNGATATDDTFKDHVNVWIGLGDQTSPPNMFLNQASPTQIPDNPTAWLPTDAGKGLTVVFARLKIAGDGRQERWPSTPPSMDVQGKFSKVYDPRDEAQDLEDSTTWKWSDNHALCVFDALQQNPFRPYQPSHLNLEMLPALADVSDEPVELLNGGSERRYRVAGGITFDGTELEQMIAPLMRVGGADFSRMGEGLGIVPAVDREKVLTLSEDLDDGIAIQKMLPSDNLYTEIRTRYSPAERGGEMAELSPWKIPGALAADKGVSKVLSLDLGMCPSATQAQRVERIIGLSNRLQRRVSITGIPDANNLVAGSVVGLGDLPEPWGQYAEGDYVVTGLGARDLLGDSGLAMRVPLSLKEYSSDVYTWDKSMERPVEHVRYDPSSEGITKPHPVQITTGEAVNTTTGGAIIPRILFTFEPMSDAVVLYVWQARKDGGDYGELSGVIHHDTLNGSGDVFVYISTPAGELHDWRVRAVTNAGYSSWSEITGVQSVVSIDLDAPTLGTPTEPVAGSVEVTATMPNDPDARGIDFYAGADSDPLNASQIGTTTFASANDNLLFSETGVPPATTRFYFARVRGDFGTASEFSTGVSITTAV